jgi:hypothetical protein
MAVLKHNLFLGILGLVVLAGAAAFFFPSQTVIPIPEAPGNGAPVTPGGGSQQPGPRLVADMIRVTEPSPGSPVESPLVITGEARGMWYFEASFPVELVDAKGKVLATAIAQAEDDWMTENFVPFRATFTFAGPPPGVGAVIFRRDNPSGLPEHDAELRVPVRFPPPSATGEGDGVSMPPCRPGGCSGQICTDRDDIVTTCEFRAEYACYRTAICERQASGECGWRDTSELRECLTQPPVLE